MSRQELSGVVVLFWCVVVVGLGRLLFPGGEMGAGVVLGLLFSFLVLLCYLLVVRIFVQVMPTVRARWRIFDVAHSCEMCGRPNQVGGDRWWEVEGC